MTTSRAFVMSPASGAMETQQTIDARRAELASLAPQAPLPVEDSWEVEKRERRRQEIIKQQQEYEAQQELIRQSAVNANCRRVLQEKEASEAATTLHFELSCQRWELTPRETRLAEKLIRQNRMTTPEQIDAVVLKVKNAGLGRPKGSMQFAV